MVAAIIYAILFVISIAAYVRAGKAANQDTQSTAGDLQVTTAEEGKTIPVVFGTCWRGHNVVQYGDITSNAVKAKGGKK